MLYLKCRFLFSHGPTLIMLSFISPTSSSSLFKRSLATHFNPCFLQNRDKKSSPNVLLKAEHYTRDTIRLLLQILLHPDTRSCSDSEGLHTLHVETQKQVRKGSEANLTGVNGRAAVR